MIGNILERWSTFSAINVEKILAKKSGPITRLGLRQLFECDVCKVSLAATSIKRHKKTVHGDSSIGMYGNANLAVNLSRPNLGCYSTSVPTPTWPKKMSSLVKNVSIVRIIRTT